MSYGTDYKTLKSVYYRMRGATLNYSDELTRSVNGYYLESCNVIIEQYDYVAGLKIRAEIVGSSLPHKGSSVDGRIYARPINSPGTTDWEFTGEFIVGRYGSRDIVRWLATQGFATENH